MRARNATPPEQRLTGEQIEALFPYGRELTLEAGAYLFDETSVVDSFYVVLEGEIRISRLDGARETQIGTHHPREFTGGLAVLAGRRSVHRGRAVVPSRVLEIDSETFRRVSAERPEIGDVFISGLVSRMRETQRAFRQHEKLAALGKLSAGLAHELNNPAAAARRASDELREAASKAQLRSLAHDERFSSDQRQVLAKLLRETEANGEISLDPLARSDREDEIAGWLENHGVEEPWEVAPVLAAAGVDEERLEELAGVLDGRSLAGGLGWLALTLELVGLAREIGTSAGRISELVGAMKEYTYMDKAAVGEVDVISGLENTMTILGPRLKGVTLRREYEEKLPRVQGRGGELKQVWTNLIDNAIDAVDG